MRWLYISLLASVVAISPMLAEAGPKSSGGSKATSSVKKSSSSSKPSPSGPVATPKTNNADKPVSLNGASKTKTRNKTETTAKAIYKPSFKLNPSLAGKSRLQAAQSSFAMQSQRWKIVKQPTTSGWTWLFLMWALHESSKNQDLQKDVTAIKQELVSLERELQQSPEEWSSLQDVKQEMIASSSMVTTLSIEDEPLEIPLSEASLQTSNMQNTTTQSSPSEGLMSNVFGVQYDTATPIGRATANIDSIASSFVTPMLLLMFIIFVIRFAMRVLNAS